MHTVTSEILKTYRLGNDLSQADMADKLEMSRELYNKVENGKLPISKGTRMAFQKLVSEEISLLDEVQDTTKAFTNALKVYDKKGYNPQSPELNAAEMRTLMLTVASQVAFLVKERQKDKKYSPERLTELVSEQMRKIEVALASLQDFS